MRVTRWPASARDERGAVAIIVGIAAIALFGFGAYAVDAGNLWEQKREVVVASDAAALAAAQGYALGENGCASAASYVAANDANPDDGTTTMTGCSPVSLGGGAGFVTVDTATSVTHWFGELLGKDSSPVASSTSAGWDMPSALKGLRPFAICDENTFLELWRSGGVAGPHKILYTNLPTECGDAPGNWGTLDFDGGNNATGELREWTEQGYDGLVSVDDGIDGNPGAISSSLEDSLAFLRASGEAVPFPLFSAVDGEGQNSTFTISGFVGARVVDYLLDGPQELRYIEVEFEAIVAEGECCATASSADVYVVFMCAVEGAPDTAHCDRR